MRRYLSCRQEILADGRARGTYLRAIALCFLAVTGLGGTAIADTPTVRLGVLTFGTVNWEVDVIRHHALDTTAGVNLEVTPLANKNATAIAINNGAVDIIVTDWIWVSRQRDAGADYTFLPYSEAAGSVMVHKDGGLRTLADLRGKVMGVAGSELDKSWLLLRAYTIETLGADIAEQVEAAYMAPPLLNEKFRQGELDSVLNFWNYTARLRALDKVELIKVQDILPALGVPGRLPLIGYVFSENWAHENPDALNGFLTASQSARKILRDSDAEWERLRPKTGAADDAALIALRDAYRDGLPERIGPEQEAAIRAAFDIVAKLGGRALVGHSTTLAPGTVWGGSY